VKIIIEIEDKFSKANFIEYLQAINIDEIFIKSIKVEK